MTENLDLPPVTGEAASILPTLESQTSGFSRVTDEALVPYQPKQIAQLVATYMDDRQVRVEEFRMVTGEHSDVLPHFRVIVNAYVEELGGAKVTRPFAIDKPTIQEVYGELSHQALMALAQITTNDAIETAIKMRDAQQAQAQAQADAAVSTPKFSDKLNGRVARRGKNGKLKFPKRG